jgi:hypothetical protein
MAKIRYCLWLLETKGEDLGGTSEWNEF